MSSFPNSIPRCQHIKVNGTQCGSPALRRKRFCFFHNKWHQQRLVINAQRARQTRVSLDLPVREDANSVQVALMQIMRLVLTGRLDTKSSALLFYAPQTASLNLKRTQFEPYETKVVIDPRNVPDTPLGEDPWSEDDYEDMEYEEDDDEEVEGEDEDDNEEEAAGEGELTAEQEEAALELLYENPGLLFGSAESKQTQQPRVADVDLARFDNEDKAAWAAMDAATRQRMVDEHKVPLKGEPPDPDKRWKIHFDMRKRAAAAPSVERKPVAGERPSAAAAAQNALVPAGVGAAGKDGRG